jgi:hypothetical protein
MENHDESWHQRQLVQWAKQFGWGQMLFHIPNETTSGQGWVIRNRQMGCRKGVPDLMLAYPKGGRHGLFIEMKKPGGRLSNEQKKWLSNLNTLGYEAKCCYGWEEARDVIQGYLAGDDTGEQAESVQSAD